MPLIGHVKPHLESPRLNIDVATEKDLVEIYGMQAQPSKYEQNAIVRSYKEIKQSYETKWSKEDLGFYCFRSKEDGHLVGCTGFYVAPANFPFAGKIDCGYWRIDDADQNKGYLQEALKVLHAYIFDDRGLDELWSMARNPRSIHIYDKMGYEYQCDFPAEIAPQYADFKCYKITSDAYHAFASDNKQGE